MLMRYRKFLISAGIILAAVLLPSGCGRSSKRYQTQFTDVFDTVSLLTGYDQSENAFDGKAELVHKELLEDHQLFDIYHSYDGMNNLKTVNDNAGIAPVRVDRKIIDLLQFGKDAYRFTDGKVNIAFGAVLRLWHDEREAGTADPEHAVLPDAAALKEAAEHTDMDDIIIDENASTVFLQDPEMSLDVGGIAKGYSVELAGKIAEDAGSASFLLNIGGNVKSIGSKADGSKWLCTVESPFYQDTKSGDRYSAETELDGQSLVTSGDYERYYTVDGVRYAHIIDPDTLYPGRFHRSVSILAADSGTADAFSTGLFLMTKEDGQKCIDEYNKSHAGEDTIEVLWIESDGSISCTDGFKEYIK